MKSTLDIHVTPIVSWRQEAADVLRVEFKQAREWATLNAAHAWCESRGVSYGSTDRTRTIALIARPDVLVAKWHNLTSKERATVDGTITGDAREGPLSLRIKRAALAALPQPAPMETVL